MKKTLLSLLGLLCMTASAAATEANVVFADQGLAASSPVEYVPASGNVLLQFSKGTANGNCSYNGTSKGVSMSKNNALLVSGGQDVVISEIVFTFSSTTSKLALAEGQAGALTVAEDNLSATWTGSSNSLSFSASAATVITAIKVTYTGEGTIVPPSVADIAAFIADKPETTVAINSSAVAVYQNGEFLWIKDNSGWLSVSGSVYRTYKNGDVIPAGYQGRYVTAQYYPQMNTARNFGEATPGTPVEPEAITTAGAVESMLNAYVSIKNAAFAASGDDFTCTDAAGSLLVKNQFKVYVTDRTDVSVNGFLVRNSEGAILLYLTSLTDAQGLEFVQNPTFSVAAGEVIEGTELTLATKTADAAIYYTLDGTEPTAASTLYAGAIKISENMTVKAVAIKEGMANSQIISADYTVKAAPKNEAIFNFGQFSSLMVTDAWGNAASAKFADATTNQTLTSSDVFVAGDVSLVITKGTTDPLINVTTPDLRPGKGAILTITTHNGNKITSIILTGGKVDALTTTSEGSYVQSTGIYTAPEGGLDEVVLKTPTSGLKAIQISTINVVCANDMADSTTGINAVISDDDAPVEYYNLQGIRVLNPADGIFIRRQGNTVTKVLVK